MDKSDGELANIKDPLGVNSDIEKNTNSVNNNSNDNQYSSSANNNSDTKLEYEYNLEKPYCETKKTDEAQAKKKNIFSSFYDYINNYINNMESQEEVLIKTFFHLIIQFIIIFIFTLLGFIYEINEAFVASTGAIWGTLVPTTVVILIMCFTALCIEDYKRGSKWLYIYLIIYIPCVVFYFFLLSGATNNINIICGLVLYILDILSFIIVIMIYKEIRYIVFIIFSVVITIIILLIFHFVWIKDGLITFKISTVGLSEIIYLIIITKFSIYKVEEYLFETIVFDLAIFSPLAFIIFIIAVIAFFYGMITNQTPL